MQLAFQSTKLIFGLNASPVQSSPVITDSQKSDPGVACEWKVSFAVTAHPYPLRVITHIFVFSSSASSLSELSLWVGFLDYL